MCALLYRRHMVFNNGRMLCGINGPVALSMPICTIGRVKPGIEFGRGAINSVEWTKQPQSHMSMQDDCSSQHYILLLQQLQGGLLRL